MTFWHASPISGGREVPEGYMVEKPFSFSCPECGGVLRRADDGNIKRYRCHIGHLLTAEAVLVAQSETLEMKLGGCLALLNERADLCNEMAAEAHKRGEKSEAFEAAAREARTRAEHLKAMLESE